MNLETFSMSFKMFRERLVLRSLEPLNSPYYEIKALGHLIASNYGCPFDLIYE